MNPIRVLRAIWNCREVPPWVLEICFISLLRHIDWLPVFNETVLYSLLHVFVGNSALAAGRLFAYESGIILAVYWNPYKLLGYLCPEFILSSFPNSVLQGIDEVLKCINIAFLDYERREHQHSTRYPDLFRLKFKSLTFLFATFSILASPSLVCSFYIAIVVYYYLFHFQIKTFPDLAIYFLIGLILWSTEMPPEGVYMYLYVIICHLLLIVWVRLKYFDLETANDRLYMYGIGFA